MPSGSAPATVDEGDDDVEHQPAPQAGVDVGQPEHAADQQDAGQQREQRSAAAAAQSPRCRTRSRMTGAAKATSRPAGHDRRRQQLARRDSGPRRTVCSARLMKVQQAPSPVQASVLSPTIVACVIAQRKQRRHDQPEQRQHQQGQQRVRDRAEEVAAQPVDRASGPPAAVAEAPRSPPGMAASAGLRRHADASRRVAHRSTRATRRLYQFMKAEKSRLMVRKTAIT